MKITKTLTSFIICFLCLASAIQAENITVNYSYDHIGRLTEVGFGSSIKLNYTYDAAGNITSVAQEGDIPPVVNLNSNTWLGLTDSNVQFPIPSNGRVQIFNTDKAGTIKVAQGGQVEFQQFSGAYIVILDEDSSEFMVNSAGNNRVNLTSSNGTIVSMTASTSAQTIYFKDGRSLLSINNGSLMLGTQNIDSTASAVASPANNDQPPANTSATPTKVNTFLALTDASAELTIPYGAYAQIYGSTGANTISLASGAKAECINFVGENIINFVDDSASDFTVRRSGAMVYFESSAKGTTLKIPATKTIQSINFADGKSYELVINNGKVMLNSQEVITAKVQF
ncbi:MAG: hypothetical protein AB7U45_11355 [Desulfamplus sp.]